jgi:putative peptidoglycan lipid II flippase
MRRRPVSLPTNAGLDPLSDQTEDSLQLTEDPTSAPFEPTEDPTEQAGIRSSPVLGGAIRATALLAAAGMVGQVFTLLRELFVASEVGVSVQLDALLVASVFPILIAGFLSNGTTAAVVPAYAAAAEAKGPRVADRLLGATVTWTFIAGLLGTIVVVLAAPLEIEIAGPGLDAQSRAQAIAFVPVVAPLVVLLAAGSILTAVFQVHDRMRMIGPAWILGPFLSLIVTVVLWPSLDLTALALATVAQQLIIVLALIGLAWRMRIYPPITLRADADQVRPFLHHASPLTVTTSVLSLNLLTDRAVATLIVPGGLAALRYADGIIRLPINAVLPAWGMAIYPALVRATHLGDTRSLGVAAGAAMRYVTVIFVPLSVAIAALAPLIVTVAYSRGAFDEQATLLTAGALAAYAPLLFLNMASSVLTGSHNARRRGMFLLWIAILNAVLNVVLNIGFGLLIGVAGIALSSSVTVGVIQFLKAWRLGDLDESFPLARELKVGAKSLVAGSIIAIPIALVAWTLPQEMAFPIPLLLLAALTFVGMAGYVAISWVLGLQEPWIITRALLRSPVRIGRGARRWARRG